ncbi:hypothetical protein BAUCODRAFT_339517 [Baudoinia panamericana UAMH 10762]|uniref:Uncharacterized protein n=1 Tax=Baudoinia panamericana (strain UAMH 10762) TaxID=717646 RepID=M2LXW2_BAUPA|nr:uncharacterized protein BAUCODRAFT_339517 [Baudoinia panamericana UAMH 10762]EMC99517.1 hypothetical protein BAUCODRAFT_339517 [Baudoinia panamericana UAMH 10762]
MAAMKPFDTLRNWMTGRPQEPTGDDQLPNIGIASPVGHPRRRRITGIREHTDDSSDLPSSREVLQHLAFSKDNGGVQHLGEDARRYTSYATTLGSDDHPPGHRDTYESIEAELDALKLEVLQLKTERDHSGHSTAGQQVDSENMLPAVLLDTAVTVNAVHSATGKASLASAADREGSVIVSSLEESVPQRAVIGPGSSSSSPTAKSLKSPPRFAQPTESYSRRTGETRRKDSVVGYSSPEALSSPMKALISGKPDIASSKRAAQREVTKRTRLPIDWQGEQPIKSGKASAGDAAEFKYKEELKGDQALRKKKSSYTSPTEAATQRIFATLNDGGTRRSTGFQSGKTKANIPVTSSAVLQLSKTSTTTPTDRIANRAVNREGPAIPRLTKKSAYGHREGPASRVMSPGLAVGATNVAFGEPSPHGSSSRLPRARVDTTRTTLMRHGAADAASMTIPPIGQLRRTSRADIMQPIYEKLERLGLARNCPDASNLSESAVQAREASAQEEEARKLSAALENVTRLARQGIAGKQVIVPSRMQVPEREFSATSSKLELDPGPTKSGAAPGPLGVEQAASSDPFQRSTSLTLQPQSVSKIQMAAITETARETSSAASSLRATAKPFTPIWTPETPAQEFGLLSWQGSLGEYTPEEWSALPKDVRNHIEGLRKFKAQNTVSPSCNLSPSKRAEQRFWGRVMGTAGLKGYTTASTIGLQQHGLATPLMSANGVQPGQKLVPQLSSGQGNAQRVLEDLDGQKKPVNFGERAPLSPALTNLFTEPSPIISPASNDTSPPVTPQDHLAWTIGPGYAGHRRAYGWQGGDGKEISFSGYGPQAEANPYSPVNMLYYPCGAVHRSTQQGRYKADASLPAKVWPRSMKQWAEYAQLTKVPCSQVNVLAGLDNDPLAT